MISLFGGRLTLSYDLATHQWLADIKLSPNAEHQITLPTGERDARKAMQQGMSVYDTFSEKLRLELQDKGALMCWQCLHWETSGRGHCLLKIPEARKTRGRFAAGCSLFTPCPRQP